MMNNTNPAGTTSLVMIAWNKYKETDGFKNTKKWAANEKHVDGSLWAAFLTGFNGGKSAPQETPEVEGDVGDVQDPVDKAIVTLETLEGMFRDGSDINFHSPSLADDLKEAASTIEALSADFDRAQRKGFELSAKLAEWESAANEGDPDVEGIVPADIERIMIRLIGQTREAEVKLATSEARVEKLRSHLIFHKIDPDQPTIHTTELPSR